MSDLTHIVVSPEWGSSGLWTPKPSMISYERLPIPPELVERIKRWHDTFDNWPPEKPRPEGFWPPFEEEQLRLTEELARVLGGEYVVKCTVSKTYRFRGGARVAN